MRSNKVTANKIDWWLLGLYFALTTMGLFNIYSASYNPEHSNIYDNSQEYGKQLTWLVVSLSLAGIILLLDGAFIRSMSLPFYAFCMALLVLVILVGTEVNGAKAWFGIGSFGIQPSEFSKVAISMTLAKYLSTFSLTEINKYNKSGGLSLSKIAGLPKGMIKLFTGRQIWVFLIILFPAALIMLQPDTGTVIVFTGFIFMFYREGLSGNILMFMFFIFTLALSALMLKDTTVDMPFIGEGTPGKYVIIVILTFLTLLAVIAIMNFAMKRTRKKAVLIAVLAWLGSSSVVWSVDFAFHNVLGNHQKERIDIFLGLKEDPDGKGYNIDRAMAAIGSGSITGKGYMQATLANKSQKHVPMQSTDFIFCTLSEEWGFLGSFTVLLLFMFLLVRIIIIAERQRLAFTRIYAYCVACIFFMHILINMGMAIGLVPVIGIPLPFFSYGGSSLMGFTILLFILIRLDAERMDVLK